MSKPQPHQLKILSIFKNDKFFKKIPNKTAIIDRTSRSPSFRDFKLKQQDSNKETGSSLIKSRRDRSDSVKERLSYSQNISFKEEKVTPKVTTVPYNVLTRSNRTNS